MAKPNYAFEKRQRDLAKKQKKEEKRLKKTTGGPADAPTDDTAEPRAGTDEPAGAGTPAAGADPAAATS